MSKKTYEDFGIMLEKLKLKTGASYEPMGREIGINASTLQRWAKIRAIKLPEYEDMEKVAGYFRLEPEFFYEYRLKKVLDYVDQNRKSLDLLERAVRKAQKEPSTPADKKESAPTEVEATQKQSA